MAKRLTDKKKKQIIADYINSGEGYRAVARRHKVSDNTVKSIVAKNRDIAQKCAQKKEQTTTDLLKEMEKLNNNVLAVYNQTVKRIHGLVSETKDPQRLAIAAATLIDKQLLYVGIKHKQAEIDLKAREVAVKESESKGVTETTIQDSLSQLEKMVEIARKPLPPHELP